MPASAQTGTDDTRVAPVAPLTAIVNAAALGPYPANGARYVIQRYDDSREHDAVQQALEESLARLGRGGDAGAAPLDMEFEIYVIRSGVPVLATGILATRDVRHPDVSAGPPPSVDVTEMQDRTAGVEGNVLHQRQDSFSAIMRLQVTVSDPADNAYLWRGWVDTPLNGLSRAQAVALVADPLFSALGQTVARQEIAVQVPESMGGAPEPTPDAPETR